MWRPAPRRCRSHPSALWPFRWPWFSPRWLARPPVRTPRWGLAPAAIFVIGHIAIWGLSARGPRSSSGVMNLLQIAAITVFVLLEKVLLFGERGCRVMGPLMVFAGLLALVGVGWN